MSIKRLKLTAARWQALRAAVSLSAVFDGQREAR